jgi:hypothetical protein
MYLKMLIGACSPRHYRFSKKLCMFGEVGALFQLPNVTTLLTGLDGLVKVLVALPAA